MPETRLKQNCEGMVKVHNPKTDKSLEIVTKGLVNEFNMSAADPQLNNQDAERRCIRNETVKFHEPQVLERLCCSHFELQSKLLLNSEYQNTSEVYEDWNSVKSLLLKGLKEIEKQRIKLKEAKQNEVRLIDEKLALEEKLELQKLTLRIVLDKGGAQMRKIRTPANDWVMESEQSVTDKDTKVQLNSVTLDNPVVDKKINTSVNLGDGHFVSAFASRISDHSEQHDYRLGEIKIPGEESLGDGEQGQYFDHMRVHDLGRKVKNLESEIIHYQTLLVKKERNLMVEREKLLVLANLRQELTETYTKLSLKNVFLTKQLAARKVREEELQEQICELEGELTHEVTESLRLATELFNERKKVEGFVRCSQINIRNLDCKCRNEDVQLRQFNEYVLERGQLEDDVVSQRKQLAASKAHRTSTAEDFVQRTTLGSDMTRSRSTLGRNQCLSIRETMQRLTPSLIKMHDTTFDDKKQTSDEDCSESLVPITANCHKEHSVYFVDGSEPSFVDHSSDGTSSPTLNGTFL